MHSGLLSEQVDLYRVDAARRLDPSQRAQFGQFLTPSNTALLMASMFQLSAPSLHLLDAGAGVGSLSAAFVSEICRRPRKPKSLKVTAYEIDPKLARYLRSTVQDCQGLCESVGISFAADVLEEDFIRSAVGMLRQEVFAPIERFNCAILNPPYRKIAGDSEVRLQLREAGIETSNLYTGFLSLVILLLAPEAELVAITPRSFCNGPYFKPFRQLLLKSMQLRRIHVFESRQTAFSEDGVLQENVIFHAEKGDRPRGNVVISAGSGPDDDMITVREVPYSEVVQPDDHERFIRLVADGLQQDVRARIAQLTTDLAELRLQVSTGRVVDFRAKKFLKHEPDGETVPLIYPLHFDRGWVRWPKPGSKKPNAIRVLPEADDLLVPSGNYALVRRFSSKEEDRRVVAAVFEAGRIPAPRIGFENHLNYFHRNGRGIPLTLAKGLAAFLNSTMVDLYFRQFSGHTQVNAVDLRNLKYPTEPQLERIGELLGTEMPHQTALDDLVEREIFNMANEKKGPSPVKRKKKIDQASAILKALGLPAEQYNDRSALTLLALVGLSPDIQWSEASDPLMGITPMMDFFEQHYGKKYQPNARETVRRRTVHQFLEAALIVINPDEPGRPTNSPHSVYQIEQNVLELVRSFGTAEWEKNLGAYLARVKTLKEKYAREREMQRIPIEIAPGKTITLSPGGQNVLVEQIIGNFCELFTPGAKPIYIGDTGEKFAYYDEKLLARLGVTVDAHGKMPDVVVYDEAKNWLVLIEAVKSHGPVDPKRRAELMHLFQGSKAGLIFVTAFLDRHSMVKYLSDISWETEVWVAEAPTHVIHFDGERFLGPYPNEDTDDIE